MKKGILVDFMKEHGKTIVDMLSVEFTEVGRTDDLFRSMEDPAYQQLLLEEFGL